MDSSAKVFNKSMMFLDDTAEDQLNIAERTLKKKLVNDIIDLGNTARILNFKAQAVRDSDVMQLAIKKIDEMDAIFDQLYKITRDAEDISLLDNTRKATKRYQQAVSDFLVSWNERESLGASRNKAGQELLASAQSIAEAGMNQTTKISNGSEERMNLAMNVLYIGEVLSVLIGVILAIYITRSITKPLNLAVETLSIGADEVAGASSQVSSASQSLAEGASEQASSLEETSSSLEEMASMTRRNSDNANSANSLAAEIVLLRMQV